MEFGVLDRRLVLKTGCRIGVALFMHFLSVAVDSLDDIKFRTGCDCIYKINYILVS